jgi:hypothetical protein
MMTHRGHTFGSLPALPWRRLLKLMGTLLLLLMICGTWPARLQAAPSASDGPTGEPLRDGSHDFDFDIGTWHTHIRRILDPLSGSSDSIELTGTVTVRKVWGGRAQLEEIEADGPNGHWEGMSLFLYNPQSHQWSQSFINSKIAELNAPLIGSFKDGRGELFSGDTFHGKSILVRGEWSAIETDSHRYEESYSADGGETWAPSFVADLTRDRDAAADGAAARLKGAEGYAGGQDGQQGFDFDLGNWKTHSTRLMHPLTGSHDWVQLDGTSVVSKVWNGRANLAEYRADGPAGHLELMALRWFNPTTHEWNINFATPNVGTLGVPGVGVFKDGRTTFYDYELVNGRSVLVRFSIWSVTHDTARSEQAFSVDGGKTWEVNWINEYTRMPEM